MYHRMYLRRCSMSSISEESETGDDDHLDDEFIVCNNNNDNIDHRDNNDHGIKQREQNVVPSTLAVETCLGDLNTFKQEIREAYEELSTLEKQALNKTKTIPFCIERDDLELLLEQLQALEKNFDDRKVSNQGTADEKSKQSSISSTIMAQFDELDQALATLANTLNNVELELNDPGTSSSSSGLSESTTTNQQQSEHPERVRQHDTEFDEHFSDSGLSQSTESISLPLKTSTKCRTNSQLSTNSSIVSTNENPIRTALEKLQEANIRKMFVKIHHSDQSTKNILIDETMSVKDVLLLVLYKNQLKMNFNQILIEELPDLHIYRVLEDNKKLIEDVVTHWPRDTNNRISFDEDSNFNSIFTNAKEFFSINDRAQTNSIDSILSEYISSENIVLPDNVAGSIYFKDKNRKVWKKVPCVLRQSGIYQVPKASSSKRDLICLIKFDRNLEIYRSKNWTENLRSPTEFGFALKFAHIQKKSNKYIHYICTNTFQECQRWINSIRIIIHGIDLYKNFQTRKQLIGFEPKQLIKHLPSQHYFNSIKTNSSTSTSISNSIISLPINRIVSDLSSSTSKSMIDFDNSSSNSSMFHSLDRGKKTKHSFTRSSSFHSSLRRSSKIETNLKRTCSISPPDISQRKFDELDLKRSKSSREIVVKPNHRKQSSEMNKSSSTSSIIPFINQCIQPERTTDRVKPNNLPKRRAPPPIPNKFPSTPTITVSTVIIDNHIYDSFQENPSFIKTKRTFKSNIDNSNDHYRTVTPSRLLTTRVTEL